MKITVITGTPRRHGNSFVLTDAFIKKAEKLDHTVQRFDVALMNIGGCHACNSCFKTGKACSFDDDFNLIAPPQPLWKSILLYLPCRELR